MSEYVETGSQGTTARPPTSVNDIRPDCTLRISRFATAFPKGPALGTEELMTWDEFAGLFRSRRSGEKDGPGFVPARFRPEQDGRVRRLLDNVFARTAIGLDIETNKARGQVPPPVMEAVERIKTFGWAAVVYTTHDHIPEAPRYRVVVP